MRRLVVLGWIAACLLLNSVQAQTIHAIIVGDTIDGSIGPGVSANLKNISAFLDTISVVSGIPVATKVIDGGGFNCRAIVDSISHLNVNHADMVLFYYSGHGLRQAGDTSLFPEFDCRRTVDPVTVKLDDVLGLLPKDRLPHLIFAIADACNKEVTPSLGFNPPTRAEIKGPDAKAAFKHLFSDYDGVLTMSSSKEGELSWYMTTGDSGGGFFTNQFLQSVGDVVSQRGKAARWEDIVKKTENVIWVPQENAGPIAQSPQATSTLHTNQ